LGRALTRSARGFTLLELLVVLVVIALAAAFAIPAVQGGWESRQIRQGTRKLASLMRGLRERAVRQGVQQEMLVEPDGQTIHWSDGETMILPQAAWITGVRGGWRDQDGSVRVVFYPNGGTTGAGLLVGPRDDEGLRFAIDVDALLGSVTIRDVTS
jgi:general secretion pathway protein H